MSEFEKTREKFEDALLNLEQLVDNMVNERLEDNKGQTSDGNSKAPEDLTIIKKERDELKEKLLEATENYNSLSSVTAQLSNRLDETIKKLKSILE